jgi:hypothetical protein
LANDENNNFDWNESGTSRNLVLLVFIFSLYAPIMEVSKYVFIIIMIVVVVGVIA